MNYREELLANFESLGVNVTEDVIEKCELLNSLLGYIVKKREKPLVGVQLCRKYDVSAEELCDQWFAYTASNLKEIEPTVQALEAMEIKEFAKHSRQVVAKQVVSTPTSSKFNKSANDRGYPFTFFCFNDLKLR